MYYEYFNILNKLDEQYLTESSELYSGIFWIVDLDNCKLHDEYPETASLLVFFIVPLMQQAYSHHQVYSTCSLCLKCLPFSPPPPLVFCLANHSLESSFCSSITFNEVLYVFNLILNFSLQVALQIIPYLILLEYLPSTIPYDFIMFSIYCHFLFFSNLLHLVWYL